ncbi:MAG: STAS domain-containing protein [Spirochaetota bacterium]
MFIETTKLDSILVVTPHEDIIRENSEDVERAIFTNVNKSTTDVILDCKHVQYINSFSLGTLVKIHQKLEENSRKLHFLNVAPSIKTLFKITRVLDYFSLIDSMDDVKNKK